MRPSIREGMPACESLLSICCWIVARNSWLASRRDSICSLMVRNERGSRKENAKSSSSLRTLPIPSRNATGA